MTPITKYTAGKVTIPARKITSLANYVEVIEIIAREWRQRTKERREDGRLPSDGRFPGEMVPWFRGTTSSRYPLEPTLLRKDELLIKFNENKEGIKILEDSLWKRFKFGGRHEFSRLKVERKIDWIFLMQHHGLPTRLLDWSKNALTALYFAIRKQKEKEDAAVWIIDPRRLNEACDLGRNIAFPEDNRDARLDEYYNLEPRTSEYTYPIPVITPPFLSERLAAQQSRFTYHTDERSALDRFAKTIARADNCWYLIKLIIPSHCQPQILQTLRLVGITLPDITPGLDNIALEIRHRLELGVDY